MSLPILGNQYFNQIENVASSQVQRIFSDSVVTTNLTVAQSYKLGALKYTTIIAYSPTVINGGGLSSFTLQSSAGGVATTADTAVTLPVGAILKELYVVNTGVPIGAGGQLITIGAGTLNGAPGSAFSTTGLLSVATANANILIDLGTNGVGSGTSDVDVTPNNFLSVRVTGAGVTTAAVLNVYLTYAEII